MRRLPELAPWETGIVAGISGDERLIARVSSIGLTPGCEVRMLQNEKKQPVLIYARDTMIAVNRQESEKIEILEAAE